MRTLKGILIAALLLGAGYGVYAWQHAQEQKKDGSQQAAQGGPVQGKKIYQCPMHPQIVRDHPGECPICHMELQLVSDGGADAGTQAAGAGGVAGHAAFSLSEERRQLIGVRTEKAELGDLLRTLRLPGRVGEGSGVILAQVLEMDGPLVKPGLEADVWVAGMGSRKARVASVDRVLDAYSRTFSVRLALEPGADRSGFVSGVYCDVRVRLRLGRGLLVLKEAVLDTGDKQWVFVQKEGGRFEPRAVETGREGDAYVEIRRGVEAGETLVTSANFLIDSESRFQAAARDFGGKP